MYLDKDILPKKWTLESRFPKIILYIGTLYLDSKLLAPVFCFAELVYGPFWQSSKNLKLDLCQNQPYVKTKGTFLSEDNDALVITSKRQIFFFPECENLIFGDF